MPSPPLAPSHRSPVQAQGIKPPPSPVKEEAAEEAKEPSAASGANEEQQEAGDGDATPAATAEAASSDAAAREDTTAGAWGKGALQCHVSGVQTGGRGRRHGGRPWRGGTYS